MRGQRKCLKNRSATKTHFTQSLKNPATCARTHIGTHTGLVGKGEIVSFPPRIMLNDRVCCSVVVVVVTRRSVIGKKFQRKHLTAANYGGWNVGQERKKPSTRAKKISRTYWKQNVFFSHTSFFPNLFINLNCWNILTFGVFFRPQRLPWNVEGGESKSGLFLSFFLSLLPTLRTTTQVLPQRLGWLKNMAQGVAESNQH